MKGKIIKIDDDKIVVRPCENFLDIVVDTKQINNSYLKTDHEVEISFRGSVIVIVNNLRLYGKFQEES